MKAFVNYFGHFPLASGPDSISSLRDESHLVSGDQRPSFFSFLDSHVLSFIPHPPETKGTHLYCVARDSLGRYIWHNQLNYHEKPVQPPEEQQAGVIPDIEIPCSVDETKVIPAICKGMAPDDQKLFEETQRQVERLRTQEQKMDTSAKPSTAALQAPQVEATSENAVRLFCSHFGFSCLPNWGRFTPTRASTELAKPIDREISRECYSAGILYFDKSGVPCFEMELPKDFNDFIWNVGWPVNMAEHMGYKGGLSPSKTGAMAPYYASYNLEVIFQVGPLTPPNEVKSNYIQSLIFSNQVIVCWVEDLHTFYPDAFKLEYQVLIVIEPQPSRLYRVKIYQPST